MCTMLHQKLADKNSSFKSYDVELAEIQETTCNTCNITYENFQKLLNHSCLPYRCQSCSMAFLYDYMLKMHKCDVKKHVSTRSQTNDYEPCSLSFLQRKLLSQHQSSCASSHRKHCNICKQVLSRKCQGELCRKCKLITRKYKDHSLEYSKLNKNLPNIEMLHNNFTKSHNETSSVPSESASTSSNSSELPNLRRRKKYSASNISEKFCKKSCPEKHIINETELFTQNVNDKCKPKRKNVKSDCEEVAKNCEIKNSVEELISDNIDCEFDSLDSCKSFKVSNMATRKKVTKDTDLEIYSKKNTLKTAENVDNFDQCIDRKRGCRTKVFGKNKPVDSKENSSIVGSFETTGIMIDSSDSQSNDIGICKSSTQSVMKNTIMDGDLSETCSANGNSEAEENNKYDSNDFPIFSSEIKCNMKRKLPKVCKVKKRKSITDTEPRSSKKHVVSILSQPDIKNSFKKSNFKSDEHTSTYCDLYESYESNLRKKSPNGTSSAVYPKTNATQIPHNFFLFSKNNKISEIPYSIYNMDSYTKTIEESIGKKKEMDLQMPPRYASHLPEGSENIPTVGISTPVLEIAESTLNCVSDDVLSRATSFSSINEESEKQCISSCLDSNCIKLENLLNALPDESSGILLRITSKNGDNFRCLKCNKLFKRIKVAAIHYSNCRNFRIKKKMLVSLNDIEWVCLQCHFHCNYVAELTNHKQSCHLPSIKGNFNIESCINHYPDTCKNTCSKCNYSSLSSVMFKQHDCEKRLQHMKKCFIPIKKLSKYDLFSAKLAKYRCESCELDFYNTFAYQKHENEHKIADTTGVARCYFIDGKEYAEEEMKRILKKTQDLQTADDIIKSWIQPISQLYTNLDNFPFPGLDLNILIPQEIDKLLPDVAKQLLSVHEKSETLGENVQTLTEENLYVEIMSSVSSFFNVNETNPNDLTSDEGALKGFKCVCKKINKKYKVSKNPEDSEDTKDNIIPCQHCLSSCVVDKVNSIVDEDKVILCTIETSLKNSETPVKDNPHDVSVDITEKNTFNDIPKQSTSFPDLPINIISVASCSNQEIMQNTGENSATSCLTQVPSTSQYKPGVISDNIPDLNVDSSSLCDQSKTASGSRFRTVFTRDKNFRVSREPVENDFTTITVVTLTKLPMRNSKYVAENYDKLSSALNNFKDNCVFEADLGLSSSNTQSSNNSHDQYFQSETQGIFQNFDSTVATPNNEPLSFQSDSPPENFLNSEGNSNTYQNLLPDGMHHLLNSTTAFAENCESQCASTTDNILSLCDIFIFTCPVDKIIKFLTLQKPCNVDITLSNNIFDIHVTWELISDVGSCVFHEDIDSNMNYFICGRCFDCISSSDLSRHFYKTHGERELNVLIT